VSVPKKECYNYNMKRLLSFISILLILAALISLPAFAKDESIHMNAAYWKGGETFDIVVKEKVGTQLKLYVNDKNPVSTTVNDKGWATFKKVFLRGSGKISFTRLDKDQHEHPVDYTSNYSVPEPKATFTEVAATAPVAKPATTPPVVTPAPQPTPAPVPAPTPAPQPSVYYKNCTAARAAGAAPVYRGQPGYAAHLDRDNDGIGCE